MTLKVWAKQNKLLLVFFIIYLAVTFVTLFFHESWGDEAQAWLTARDCSPIELIGRMKYEGHFLPWYLIIMPFAKLGFPFRTINVISWIITVASAWLMIRHLPCKKYIRVLLIFTMPMIYLYPVIARCYCLVPLAMILLIMFYKKRFKKPAPYLFSIILLVNVHTYCFMLALILGVEFLIDWHKQYNKLSAEQNQNILKYTIIAVLLVLLCLLPLLDSVNGASGVNAKFAFNLKYLLFHSTSKFISYLHSAAPTMVLYTLFAIALSYLFLHKWEVFWKSALAILWHFVIYSYVFPLVIPQRVFICFFIFLLFLMRGPYPVRKQIPPVTAKVFATVFLLAMVIISGNIFCEILAFAFILVMAWDHVMNKKHFNMQIFYHRFSRALFLIIVSVFVMDGFCAICNEMKYRYSQGYAVADYIRNNLLAENDAAVFLEDLTPATAYTPIIAYIGDMDFKMYDVNIGEFFTYVKQTATNELYDDKTDKLKDYCSVGGEHARCYYVANFGKEDAALTSLRDESSQLEKLVEEGALVEIYTTSEEDDVWNQTDSERFRIYEVKRDGQD